MATGCHNDDEGDVRCTQYNTKALEAPITHYGLVLSSIQPYRKTKIKRKLKFFYY